MQIQNEHHSFTGMQRDLSSSKHPTSFLYDAKNIRLTPREGDTMFAITNERGTEETKIVLNGIYLGHCILNEYLVVFTTDSSHDYIHKVNLETTQYTQLYKGNLKFDVKYPIKAIGSFENKHIQKVYWTDGENQPRVINIVNNKTTYNDKSFDFVPTLALQETVDVYKLFGSGEFPPGVIQYAFTYFNKYMQESNIFHVTPLHYITYNGRAGSPEDKISNSFKIKVSNVDSNFDYLRIYSILRTSIEGTPIVKRVQDIQIRGGSYWDEEPPVEDDNTGGDDSGNEDDNTNTGGGSGGSGDSTPEDLENIVPKDSPRNWVFRYGERIDDITISLDGGETFISPEDYAKNPEDLTPPNSDKVCWTKDIVNGSNSKAYLFSKYDIPNLVIKLVRSNSNIYYYTWTPESNYIYLGVSDDSYIQEEGVTGYTVLIGAKITRDTSEPSPIMNYKICNTSEDDIELVQGRIDYIETSDTFSIDALLSDSDISISYDDGFTFKPIPVEYKIDPEETFDLRDFGIWSTVYKTDERTVYKLSSIQLGLVTIRIGNYYYKTESVNSILYLGTTPNEGGKTVIMGINDLSSTPKLSNLNRYTITSNYSINLLDAYSEDPVLTVTFIDDGTKGDIIDPSELLYKGGENIKVKSIIQKDNTLFLGNVSITRDHPNITNALYNYSGIYLSDKDSSESNNIANDKVVTLSYSRHFKLNTPISHPDTNPVYSPDTLNSINSSTPYSGASFFKSKEYYRLGIQFQHENGKWTEPYWIGDKQCDYTPLLTNNISSTTCYMTVGGFKYTLEDPAILKLLTSSGYKKARGLYAVPSINDRTILCQGVCCPTLYRLNDRYTDSSNSTIGSLYAQSSWIFRHRSTWSEEEKDYQAGIEGGGNISYEGKLVSHFDNVYTKNESASEVNISPYIFSTEVMGKYSDRDSYRLDHSFSTLHSPDVLFDDSFYSIDFTGCSIKEIGYIKIKHTYGDISIQTSSPTLGSSSKGFKHYARKIYNGSLISGFFYEDYLVDDVDATPKYVAYKESDADPVYWPIFMWHKNGSLNNDVNREGRSAELLKKKISNYTVSSNSNYFNTDNIKTYSVKDIKIFKEDQLSLIKVDGKPYMGNIETMLNPEVSPYYFFGDPGRVGYKPLASDLYAVGTEEILGSNASNKVMGIYKFNSSTFKWDFTEEKIGEHVKGLGQWSEGVSIKYKSTPHLVISYSSTYPKSENTGRVPLLEVVRPYDKNIMYGGVTKDALYSNIWIPCGPSVDLNDTSIKVEYKWGDTYLQRHECLKTYAFTPEDKNQVVDIISFLCETRINIDGRYDRNKEQTSNLNVSPTNFNLLNPVYSQLNNFFKYRMLEEDYYILSEFPNQIIWSKEKQLGSEVDLYTNITLASTYDLDGSKGEITSLNVWNDSIYCFQNKGISNILFNSRVQIPTSDNVPIEISNSYKLDGHRYISDNMGCDNFHKIKETPSGIYFIDSISNRLFNIGKELSDVTTTHNMSSWFKYNGSSIDKILYDNINSDLYLVTPDTALCFSEVLGQFTSFMDYGGISLMESCNNNVFTLKDSSIYKLFTGEYNKFFGEPKEWKFTFISNGVDNSLSDFDKIFSNIDYRLDIKESGEYKHDKSLDYIRVENEYQDTGEVKLVNRKIVDNKVTYSSSNTNLKKKFRIWRIQIPRDSMNEKHKMDRIRNTWCKITLGNYGTTNSQTVLHDLNVQYYV